MEINGIIRVNMTGAEIEAALLKAKDLPTATELQEELDAKATTTALTETAETLGTAIGTKASKTELTEAVTTINTALAGKQDTLTFATDEDIEEAFGGQ